MEKASMVDCSIYRFFMIQKEIQLLLYRVCIQGMHTQALVVSLTHYMHVFLIVLTCDCFRNNKQG